MHVYSRLVTAVDKLIEIPIHLYLGVACGWVLGWPAQAPRKQTGEAHRYLKPFNDDNATTGHEWS